MRQFPLSYRVRLLVIRSLVSDICEPLELFLRCMYSRMITQQAISSFYEVDVAVIAAFEPQGNAKVLTKLPGASVVQSLSICYHTVQACKLHCQPVLLTQVNDPKITLLATESFCLFQQSPGQSNTECIALFFVGIRRHSRNQYRRKKLLGLSH